MDEVLIGSSVLAAFIGGVVALFAPCCISVMLPAYFASSFQRRKALLSMTFVFALGVGAVILPIAFGASALTRLIVEYHTPVFLAGAALMVTLGMLVLAGRMPTLPMPGMAARRGRGPGAVFALGAFSGVASACCAPVLAGVITLSGATASFGAALAVGVAYVLGMVLPLFVIAVLWDRYDWGSSALLRGKLVTVRLFGRRQVHTTALVSGVLLIVMGGLVAVLAFGDSAMSDSGWQVTLSARLQHYAAVVRSWFDGIPGWLVLTVLVVALVWLVSKAVGQQADLAEAAIGHRDTDGASGSEPGEVSASEPATKTSTSTPAHAAPRTVRSEGGQ